MTLKPHEFEEYILFAVNAFGVERCIFASNFPVDKMNAITLDTSCNLYKTAFRNWSKSDQKKIFHDNAIKFYRL